MSAVNALRWWKVFIESFIKATQKLIHEKFSELKLKICKCIRLNNPIIHEEPFTIELLQDSSSLKDEPFEGITSLRQIKHLDLERV